MWETGTMTEGSGSKRARARGPASPQARTHLHQPSWLQRGRAIFLFCIVSLLSASANGQIVPRPNSPLYSPLPALDGGKTANGLPTALKDVGIEQRLDQQAPLEAEFRDESGQAVRLGKYFGSKPVVLSLVYYDCPMLCTQVLSGMLSSFRQMSLNIGEQFEVVTVSFDPREKPPLAAAKKQAYLAGFTRPGVAEGWHFLTGDQESISQLADAVGFKYRYDTSTNQFAHASGIMVLTPQGKVARYFYGIDYPAKDLRLGLVEASNGRIGSPVDQLLLYCYHYDPATGKYGPVVMNMLRVGGILTVLAMAILILFLLPRRRAALARQARAGGAV
jgi:protein SCO1/2